MLDRDRGNQRIAHQRSLDRISSTTISKNGGLLAVREPPGGGPRAGGRNGGTSASAPQRRKQLVAAPRERPLRRGSGGRSLNAPLLRQSSIVRRRRRHNRSTAADLPPVDANGQPHRNAKVQGPRNEQCYRLQEAGRRSLCGPATTRAAKSIGTASAPRLTRKVNPEMVIALIVDGLGMTGLGGTMVVMGRCLTPARVRGM